MSEAVGKPVGAGRYAAAPGRPRALLRWGIGLLAAALAAAVAIGLGTPRPFVQGMDDWWRHLVAGAPGYQRGVLASAFDAAGHIPWALIPILLPAVLALLARHWRASLFLLAAPILNAAIVQVVKKTVLRPRPADPIVDPARLDLGSFPSGHAASMGVALVAVAAVLPLAWRRWWWPIGALLCAGMVWQRTMVGAHYLSDALAGVAIGAAVGLLAWWAVFPWLRRDFGST